MSRLTPTGYAHFGAALFSLAIMMGTADALTRRVPLLLRGGGDMRGRVLEALGGRDAGFVLGRLAHLLPPVVVGLESSLMTPREGIRWGGALLSRRDARLSEGLPGCSRGFAAGYSATRGGGGGRGRGGGGGGAAQLNNKISGAGRVEDILELVTGGVKLDFIHVSNAMKQVSEGRKARDGRALVDAGGRSAEAGCEISQADRPGPRPLPEI